MRQSPSLKNLPTKISKRLCCRKYDKKAVIGFVNIKNEQGERINEKNRIVFLQYIGCFNVEENVRNTIDIKGYLCDSEISEIRSAVNGLPVLTQFEGQLENVSIH